MFSINFLFSSRFRAFIEERANENREMAVVLSYVKQEAASAFMRFNCITKGNGSTVEPRLSGLVGTSVNLKSPDNRESG